MNANNTENISRLLGLRSPKKQMSVENVYTPTFSSLLYTLSFNKSMEFIH